MMRRTMKFLHDVGSIGVAGAMLALLVLLANSPDPAAMSEYAAVRSAMRAIADYLFLPSLMLVLVSGLLALAASPVFMNAGWALAKLGFGVIMFEGGLVGVNGPMTREAERALAAVATNEPLAVAGGTMNSEVLAISLLLFVSALNVALAVWRPRQIMFWKKRETQASSEAGKTEPSDASKASA